MNKQFTVTELLLVISALAILVLGNTLPVVGVVLGTICLGGGAYMLFPLEKTSDVVGQAFGKSAIAYALLLYIVSAAGYFV